MTDQRERIIEAIVWDCYGQTGGDDELTPLTAATVDTAMLGVCPVCHDNQREYGDVPQRCKNDAYHTAREQMESAE